MHYRFTAGSAAFFLFQFRIEKLAQSFCPYPDFLRRSGAKADPHAVATVSKNVSKCQRSQH
jgi:hypothetical protein